MSSDLPVNPPDLFERVGKITTVIASTSLILSVVYDWGFFSEIGLRYSEVPTSVSDHVRSWLIWLPHVIFVIAGYLIAEMLTRRIEHGMTEEEIIRSSPTPLLTRRRRDRPVLAAGIAGIATVILWLLFGDTFRPGVYFGLILSWFMFAWWVFSHPTVRARFSQGHLMLVYWVPPIMVFFYYLGVSDATLQLNPSRPADVLQLKSSEPAATQLKVHILRGFEGWLLVRDSNKQILWIRTDDVLRIENHLDQTPFRGAACKLYDALCFPSSAVR